MRVNINQNNFNVKVLVDKKSQQIGMQKRRFDSDFEGLLFLMSGKKQCFWMKDCIIPLDIIMIKNNVIVNIHHDCPPCTDDDCPSYCGRGNIVLELQGGTCEELNIQPGDWVEYVFD